MITDNGKELIGKFLLGQAPEYATHISIGCGAVPLDNNDTVPTDLNEKQTMDFEMTRVPLTSKGFVDEEGQSKLSFTAELPTESRYDITEVGLWSAGANNLAPVSDSKAFFNFSEPWQKHGVTIENIPFLENIGVDGDIDTTETVFSLNSSNIVLRNSSRSSRKEGPRYLDRKIMMRGDTSEITGSAGQWEPSAISPATSPTHIHLNAINFNVGSNSPSDKLKLAFSLIDLTALGIAGLPDRVKILVEFFRNEVTTTRGFAKAEIEVLGSEFDGNRYHVAEFSISDLITSQDFSSVEIRIARIFVTVFKDYGSGEEPSSDFYVCLDGFRIDNISTENPLYKMVGYSIIKDDGLPITKFQNTNNYIEFRVSLGIE